MICVGAAFAFAAFASARGSLIASEGSSALTAAPSASELIRAHTQIAIGVVMLLALAIVLAAKLNGGAWLSLFRLGLRTQSGRPRAPDVAPRARQFCGAHC